jgi:hypothetical protein
MEEKKKTIAEQYHEAYRFVENFEDLIHELIEKHEPELEWDVHIGGDDYDNSIEITFRNSIPYPWEPCLELRKAVFALGFGEVYWNFAGEKEREEVRGYEPRHYSDSSKWIPKAGYGYVDERFDAEHYEANYKKKK